MVICYFNDRGGRIVSVEEVDACTFTVYTSAILLYLAFKYYGSGWAVKAQ